MASVNGVLSSSPLKAPAVEIVDLLSDDGSEDELVPQELVGGEHEEEEEGDDDQWSLYEDALNEMGEDVSAEHGILPRFFAHATS